VPRVRIPLLPPNLWSLSLTEEYLSHTEKIVVRFH